MTPTPTPPPPPPPSPTPGHECGDHVPGSGRPVERTRRFVVQHRQAGTPACGWARACCSFYQWQQKNPHRPPAEWPGRTRRWGPTPTRGRTANSGDHVCVDEPPWPQPIEPSRRFYDRHRQQANLPACGYARVCAAASRWQQKNPHRDLPADWEPPTPPAQQPQRRPPPEPPPQTQQQTEPPPPKAARSVSDALSSRWRSPEYQARIAAKADLQLRGEPR